MRVMMGCAVFSVGISSAAADIREVIETYRDAADARVLVAGHRAGYLSKVEGNLPENSVPAIERALGNGVEILEIDIAMTKDGHLVLMHDKTLDRTTTGKGPVSDFTLEEVKSLLLRDPAGKPTKERVPTFRETMELVKGKAMVNLDKLDVVDRAKMDAAMADLRGTETVDHAIFKGGRSPSVVKKALGLYPDEVEYMPVIANKSAEEVVAILDELKPHAVEIVFKDVPTPMLSQKVMDAAKRNDTRIWINSLWASLNGGHDDAKGLSGDEDGSWGWIVRQGATIVQTDYCAEVMSYLEREKKR